MRLRVEARFTGLRVQNRTDRLSSQGQELVEPLQEAGGGEGAMGS